MYFVCVARVSCKYRNQLFFIFYFLVDFTFLDNAIFPLFTRGVKVGWPCVKEVNMDHRGSHPWPQSGRHSHRSKEKEDYHRYSHQDRDQSYPPPDAIERDRLRAHSDARYKAHFTSPLPRPEPYPYSPQQYPYSYGRPEYQRPQSRCV